MEGEIEPKKDEIDTYYNLSQDGEGDRGLVQTSAVPGTAASGSSSTSLKRS